MTDVELLRMKFSRQLAAIPSTIGISANAVARVSLVSSSNLNKIFHGRYSYGIDMVLKILDSCGYELKIEKKCANG